MSKTFLVAALAATSLLSNIGCATKSYVRNQITPINDKIGELDEISSKNSSDIKDVDSRAQQGINAADQKAGAAGESAEQANQRAARLGTGLNGLQGTVENLDNYKPVAHTTIQFGLNKSTLTQADERTLDEFAQELGEQKHYIVQVQGFTDATGPADYNNQLSRRRADAVIQYLAAKHNVPPYRIYVVGLGKDNPVAQNTSAAGRAKNRRVGVQLLTNSLETASGQSTPPAPSARNQK